MADKDRHRYWSITIENPTEADDVEIDRARQRGWVLTGQQEVGTKTGTLHYQMCLYTKEDQRFSAIKKAFSRAHIESARKPEALKQYVNKEDTRVGELPSANKPMGMAQVMELLANHSPWGLNYAALTDREVEAAFWSAVREILILRPGMISLLVQPNYIRAYKWTIVQWMDKEIQKTEDSLEENFNEIVEEGASSSLHAPTCLIEEDDDILIPWEDIYTTEEECPYHNTSSKSPDDCTCAEGALL